MNELSMNPSGWQTTEKLVQFISSFKIRFSREEETIWIMKLHLKLNAK